MMNDIFSEQQSIKIAVIDTETNWYNQVMSVGAVVADGETFHVMDSKYYILSPEYEFGGMFSYALPLKNNGQARICSREEAVEELIAFLKQYNIKAVFAYNALFDFSHLPELSEGFVWYDIMKTAAYKQFNYKITDDMDCCKTGRLKRNYGVQAILRLMTDNDFYFETHNALYDAVDELKIMKLLGLPVSVYKAIN